MIGGYIQNYALMIAGRVIFGLGGESLQVAQCTIVSVWFRGQELNFAMGLTLSISQLGSVVNGWILPSLFEDYGLGAALLVGFIVCLIAFLAAYLLCYLDRRADGYSVEDRINEEDKFNIRDIRYFGFSFWMLALTNWFIYMSVFPYIQNVSKLLIDKYNFDDRHAAILFGVPYIVSAVISPIFGLVGDKCGKRVQLIMASNLILILAFFISMVLPGCPDEGTCYYEFAPLLFVGIGYAIYLAVFWGSIPLTVEKQSVGTAFGICQSF